MVDTAVLRERVLAAWAASPARFREDANAEEELVRGAYRDRLIVELAQNAADAAAKAGVAGRLLLTLHGSTLVAANTGAPLDAAGVESMSTLRASAKRDDERSVGRFGVGFAAVLSVSDEPRVSSGGFGVRWSRSEAWHEASRLDELEGELSRRGTAVPVLRLPFDSDADVPDGYDTAVELPIREPAMVEVIRHQLAALDDALLLALPALGEVVTDVAGERRVLAASDPVEIPGAGGLTERTVGDRRWRLSDEIVHLDPELAAERPLEERLRLERHVMVAVPVVDGAPRPLPEAIPAVVHAPTPTDDRTELPVLIIADLPLDSSRRRVARGAVAATLVERIAQAYAVLVSSFVDAAVLDLVPDPLGVGEVDADLRGAVLGALADTPFVPTIAPAPSEEPPRVRPRDAVVVRGFAPGADHTSIGTVVPNLPRPAWKRPGRLRRLGAHEVELADFVDQLSSLRLAPAQWREVYEALGTGDLTELGALPVPLADGGLARGVRGVFLADDVPRQTLELFGLRMVAPELDHPLLHRLGAVPATAAAVLADSRTQTAVESALQADNEHVEALIDAVLSLVADSGLTHEDLPWLRSLELPDATGCWMAARELVLPGSPVLDLIERPDEFAVAEETATRYGQDALRSIGVRAGVLVTRTADVVLDEIDSGLADVAAWRSFVNDRIPETATPPIITEFAAIHDLGEFRDDAWAAVLRLFASDPDAREAVVTPAHVLLDDGTRVAVPSYAAWWLREHARIGGFGLAGWSAPEADHAVQTLLPALPVDIDAEFAAAVGVARTLSDVDSDLLLDQVSDPDVELDAASLLRVYAELSERDDAPDPPERVRVVHGSSTFLVDAANVTIVDTPYWLQFARKAEHGPVIVGSARLARLLDVPMAREVHDVGVAEPGTPIPVPAAIRDLVAAPEQYVEHADLRVGGVSLEWWMDGDTGIVHAATLEGVACGLAWAGGQWQWRRLIGEILAEPDALGRVLQEEQFSALPDWH